MIELPFNTIEFIETWNEYLLHREDKKKPYKNNRSMSMALKKLVRLSHNKEEIAIAILENAITENWQGFFALDRSDPLMIKLRNSKDSEKKLNAGEMLKQRYGL